MCHTPRHTLHTWASSIHVTASRWGRWSPLLVTVTGHVPDTSDTAQRALVEGQGLGHLEPQGTQTWAQAPGGGQARGRWPGRPPRALGWAREDRRCQGQRGRSGPRPPRGFSTTPGPVRPAQASLGSRPPPCSGRAQQSGWAHRWHLVALPGTPSPASPRCLAVGRPVGPECWSHGWGRTPSLVAPRADALSCAHGVRAQSSWSPWAVFPGAAETWGGGGGGGGGTLLPEPLPALPSPCPELRAPQMNGATLPQDRTEDKGRRTRLRRRGGEALHTGLQSVSE